MGFRDKWRTRVIRRYPPLSTTRDPVVRAAVRRLVDASIAGATATDEERDVDRGR